MFWNLNILSQTNSPRVFLSNFGRGPSAFPIGKIDNVKGEVVKFKCSNLLAEHH